MEMKTKMTWAEYLENKNIIISNNNKLIALEKQLNDIRHTLAYLPEDKFDEVAAQLNQIKNEIASTNRATASLRRKIKGYLAPAVA